MRPWGGAILDGSALPYPSNAFYRIENKQNLLFYDIVYDPKATSNRELL